MPKYRLSVDVPWRDILHLLTWYLNRCCLQIERAPEGFPSILPRHELQKFYPVYRSLRSFLGYRTPTATDRKARALLEAEMENGQP